MVGAKTDYDEPGSPWENGYRESFNTLFRDELLDGEVFDGLRDAQIPIDEWSKHDNPKRPYSALSYCPRRKLSSRWTEGWPCTNNQIGPLGWG